MMHAMLRRTAKRVRLPTIASVTSSPLPALPQCFLTSRLYHSYPDPDEKPIISQTISSAAKTVKKDNAQYEHLERFDMHKPFTGTENLGVADTSSQPPTRTSKLDNGLTLASIHTPGLMASFAFIVNAGSGYENQATASEAGISHMIELTSFRTSMNYQNEAFGAEIERLGGAVQCVSTRENIIYFVDVLTENMEEAMQRFADLIVNPNITEDEVAEGREVMHFLREELPSDVLAKDAVTLAAYQKSPLGNYHYCPTSRIDGITKQAVDAFQQKYYFGSNCVLSCVGLSHEVFSDIASKTFGKLRSGDANTIQYKPSIYTGGMYCEERVLKEPFVHVTFGYEIGGWGGPDIPVICVLQQLLGGGSSFSAGGPGKGMYSRLYRQVLNQYGWIESAMAYINAFEHNGLFGIDGSCQPEAVQYIMPVFIEQLLMLSVHEVDDEEFNRAKNMLKSNFLTQLESRIVLCEDLAKQFAILKHREEPEVSCANIDKVTKQDILRVMRKMLQKPPAISVIGENIKEVPRYEDIVRFINEKRDSIWAQNNIKV